MHKIIIILIFLVFLAADINGKNHLKHQNKSKISDVYVQIWKTDHPQRKIALFVQVYKHHAPCFRPWNQEKGLPLRGIECCDSKKLVTMEFSSSKESVLRILVTLRISILRMKQMFDSQTLCNILRLPVNKGCNTKCKPSALPPALDQTCQFPAMSFSSHNKANYSFSGENITNWGRKKRFSESQTVCNISFRVSGYVSKESKNSRASLRKLSTTLTAIQF